MKMKKSNRMLPKRILCLIFIFCFTLTLSACSLSDITKFFSDFDASTYTRSFLDAICKNDYTEYAKITNSTEDEAKQEYETLLDNSVTSLLSTVTVSDETKQKIREMFHSIYSKWNYEVGEATKNDDGSFSVPVTVRQLTAFKGSLTATTKRFNERTKDSADLDDGSYYDLHYQTFIEVINETIAKGEYGDETIVQVKVVPSSSDSNVYEIDSESIAALYNAAMDLSSIQEEAASLAEAE